MISVPPPVGGLNERDALAEMPNTDAYLLENIFPGDGEVRVRNGSEDFAFGVRDLETENEIYIVTESGDQLTTEGNSLPVESLMIWNGQSGASKMFAASGTAIYDVSNGGNYSTADVSGLTSARWEFTNFGNSSGHYLSIVNGSDTPRYYNGSVWASHTWTGSGLTQANLNNVMTHKNRLYYAEKNKLGFWYAPVEAINGTLAYFDLGPRFGGGGTLAGFASWSRDGGAGLDDYAVFVSSEGQAAIYQGSDPASSTDWALVGVYDISKPLGRRCFLKVGADLAYIAIDAVVSLNQILPLDRSAAQKAAVTGKINNGLREASRDYKANQGWQLFAYPQGAMAILNVPVIENQTSFQYALNVNTGAWGKFKGLDALCWALFNEVPYFGAPDGTVVEYDTGNNDRGADIVAQLGTAYDKHGTPNQKHYGLVRAIYKTNGDITPAMIINVDFDNRSPDFSPTYVISDGGVWDDASWDEANWAGSLETTFSSWLSADTIGYVGSVRMNVKTNNQSISISGFNLTYRFAGPL
jgi:hypothetical protein